MRLKLAGGEPEIVTKEPGAHKALGQPRRRLRRRHLDDADDADARRAAARRRHRWCARSPTRPRRPASPAWRGAAPSCSRSRRATASSSCPPTGSCRPTSRPKRRYPVIVTVYGGPDAGSVQNAWPGLSAHYWAQRGVITVSVDHRGSGHFGKAGTALMHRQLGTWEMTDLGTAAAWLRREAVRPGRPHRHHRRQLRRLHHGDGDDARRRPVQLRHRGLVGHRLAAVRLGLHRALHGSAVREPGGLQGRARC